MSVSWVDFFLGTAVGVLGAVVLCAQIQTRIEKRHAKKLKRLEEQAELKAYKKLMENITIRKEI